MDPVQEFAVASGWDFTTGAAITLGVGLLLAAGMMSAVPMAGRAQGYGYEISGTGPRWSTRGQRWGLGPPHAVGAGLRRHSR